MKAERINSLIPKLIDRNQKTISALKKKMKLKSLFSEYEDKASKHLMEFINESQKRHHDIKSGNPMEGVLTRSKINYSDLSEKILKDDFYKEIQIDTGRKFLKEMTVVKAMKDIPSMIKKMRNFSDANFNMRREHMINNNNSSNDKSNDRLNNNTIVEEKDKDKDKMKKIDSKSIMKSFNNPINENGTLRILKQRKSMRNSSTSFLFNEEKDKEKEKNKEETPMITRSVNKLKTYIGKPLCKKSNRFYSRKKLNYDIIGKVINGDVSVIDKSVTDYIGSLKDFTSSQFKNITYWKREDHRSITGQKFFMTSNPSFDNIKMLSYHKPIQIPMHNCANKQVEGEEKMIKSKLDLKYFQRFSKKLSSREGNKRQQCSSFITSSQGIVSNNSYGNTIDLVHNEANNSLFIESIFNRKRKQLEHNLKAFELPELDKLGVLMKDNRRKKREDNDTFDLPSSSSERFEFLEGESPVKYVQKPFFLTKAQIKQTMNLFKR